MPKNRPFPLQPLRIAVLASGTGLTLQALLDAITAGRLTAQIAGVLSNHADSGALQRAHAAGVATQHLNAATHPDAAARDLAMRAVLLAWAADVVVTAGYMQRLGEQTMAAFPRRMINVHPALLPAFGGQGMYGDRVHAAVLAAGVAETGASVHFVEGDYDSGPVLAQVRVPVLPGDTVTALSQRVKLAERELLIDVLQQRAMQGHFGEAVASA